MDEVKNVLLYSDIYHHLAPRIVGHQCPWVYQGHRVAAHPVSRLIDWSQRAVHHVPGCEKRHIWQTLDRDLVNDSAAHF